MYQCPNCAANMKFHIGKQQLYCEYCESTLSPYAFQKTNDAEENTEFNVTIFTCPQCGGELMTEDDTAATFCSYCGASTILFSRISKEKAPKYIIPFTKTKEDCKKSYKRMVNKAFFAPGKLKDSEHIEKFRGIYMPYWLYTFRKNGVSSIPGAQKSNDSKYEITKYYHLNCDVVANYDDIAFDASSTFTDSLSQAILPYDMQQKKPFTAAYLSGFYADSYDVDSKYYEEQAENIVMYDIGKQLKKDKMFDQYDVKEQMKNAKMDETLKPESADTELAMLPVWFLSYRKKDRVAYAIVNGQTGEAAADLPIDIVKFSILSLLLAIPIIMVLNSFLTVTPSTLLSCCAVGSSVFALLGHLMTTNLLFKESIADIKLPVCQENELKKQKDNLYGVFACCIFGLVEFPVLMIRFAKGFVNGKFPISQIILAIIFLLYLFFDTKRLKKKKGIEIFNSIKYHEIYKKKCRIILKPVIGYIAAIAIVMINPVSDIIYYGFACFCLAMMFWSATDIIHCHNLLTTRRLPQLKKRGGDRDE